MKPLEENTNGAPPAAGADQQAPAVSIIVPAYNAAGTIGEMIRSVLAQSFGDFELIVCDDASADGTAAIVSAFGDPRVKLIENPVNEGAGAARDRALEGALGTWVAFIDADDAWTSKRLERLLAAAENEPDVVVFDDFMKCHDGPAGLVRWERLRGPGAFGSGSAPLDVPATAFIRDDRLIIQPLVPSRLIRECDIRHGSTTFGEDTEFVLQLLAHGARLRYVPEPMYLYRLTPGSATANPQRHRLMRESVEAFVTHPGFSEEQREALRFKVSRLRRNETYATFVEATRGGRLAESMSLVVRNPWILPRMTRRLVRGARYKADRERHGGRGRDDAL